MTFIKINTAQAESLRGKYGNFHALEPVPLPDTNDYILTSEVLTHEAFSSARTTLQALPVYPTWRNRAIYRTDGVVEYGDRLWRVSSDHTSIDGRTPPLEPTRWTTMHPTDEATR